MSEFYIIIVQKYFPLFEGRGHMPHAPCSFPYPTLTNFPIRPLQLIHGLAYNRQFAIHYKHVAYRGGR